MGSFLAIVSNALLAKYVFRLEPTLPLLLPLLAGLAVVIVTLVTGWLSSRGINDQPPLEVLRQET